MTAAPCCSGACTCSAPPFLTIEAPRLRQWAWTLTALTIGWNSIEAIIAIGSGLLAGSIALMGFGLDSVVEVSSALVIAWHLTHGASETAERMAVRLIALSFFGIALYVSVDAALKLVGMGEEPERSPIGLTITALSLIVMPALAWGKRRVAADLGSVAMKADAAETQLCTYLSAVVLVGLAANWLTGWWWMDPLAGLVVAALAIREGREAWTSGDLCAC